MTTIYVPYTAGIAPLGITEMWAAGMITTEIHRATDWDGEAGTFALYDTASLTEGQESYVYTDVDGDVAYAWKVRHKTAAGKYTDFGPIITVLDTAETEMYAQEVWCRYVHPDGYVGQWVEFAPREIRINQELLSDSGNQPYSAGADYTFEMALLYKNSSGTWSGVNLTGVTEIAFAVVTTRSAAVITKLLSTSGITILDQSIDHADGGTRGHLRVWFTDADSPTIGEHNADLKVTFSDGDIVEQCSGKFEVL